MDKENVAVQAPAITEASATVGCTPPPGTNSESSSMIAPKTKKPVEEDEETLKMLNGGVPPPKNQPGAPPGETLQERFARFKKERQRERKLAAFNARAKKSVVRDQPFRDALRARYVAQTQEYLGVPYHARYHDSDPSSEHHKAPLYLDCCGLVRRVLQDLQADFGFRIGRWNQNYQFDTLPEALTFEQLKPGDLIFVEGEYTSPRSKPQKYKLVHVEVFLGGPTGEQTIGARHQRGVIRLHDSYKYESKNYEITNYYFRSLEPWLRGELECAHPADWVARDSGALSGCAGCELADAAGKRSIFDSSGADEEQGAGGDDEGEDDEARGHARVEPFGASGESGGGEAPVFFVEKGNGWKLVAQALERRGWRRLPFEYGFRTHGWQLKWVQQRRDIDYLALENQQQQQQQGQGQVQAQLVNHLPNNLVITSKLGLLETLRLKFGLGSMPDWFPESYRLDLPSDCARLLKRHSELAAAGAAGAASCVADCGEEVVWILKPSGSNCGKGIRLVASAAELRTECFGAAPGDEIEAGQKEEDQGPRKADTAAPPPAPSFPPAETIHQGLSGAESSLVAVALPESPVRGSAVAAARKLSPETEPALASTASTATSTAASAASASEAAAVRSVAVAQLYLTNPLLLEGRKFDMRVYGLIARAAPGKFLFYMYREGYARLSLVPYSFTADLEDRFAHLTNASVQKQHAAYASGREDSLWSFRRLEADLVKRGLCPLGWATDPNFQGQGGGEGLLAQMRLIMSSVADAARQEGRLKRKSGFFDLLGFDLIVDHQLKCKLLEVNTNPALHLDNRVLEDLLPRVVDDALELVLENHETDFKRPLVQPAASGDGAPEAGGQPEAAGASTALEAGGFELLIDEANNFTWAP